MARGTGVIEAEAIVAFVDVRGSTRLYREQGDARAYALVRAALDEARRSIERAGGSVVKSLGDGVMAVFPTIPAAVDGLVATQEATAALGIRVGIGLERGPCLLALDGDEIDVFGSTVNLAARLAALSDGADLVTTERVLRDPELAVASPVARVARPAEGGPPGFEDAGLGLWRLVAAPARPPTTAAVGRPRRGSRHNGTTRQAQSRAIGGTRW